MNFILFIVAIVLSVILFPIGFLFALVKSRNLSLYFRGIAESIDQMGNHVMQYAFNQWMIKGDGYKFGNIDETISSAIGKNKVKGTLTKSGKWLDRILNKLDENHSIDAIESNP